MAREAPAAAVSTRNQRKGGNGKGGLRRRGGAGLHCSLNASFEGGEDWGAPGFDRRPRPDERQGRAGGRGKGRYVGPAGQRPERGGGAGRAGGIWAGKGRWAVGREQAGGLKEGLGRERVEFFFLLFFFQTSKFKPFSNQKHSKLFQTFHKIL
jgi:hypothetical protein